MRMIWFISQRELNSYFRSPIGYIVAALLMVLSGFVFSLIIFSENSPAQLRMLFISLSWIFVLLVPALSMRTIAEELRSGSYEGLVTCPLRDVQIIIGKWLGALFFYTALLLPTLIYVVLLEIWAAPDYGPILTGYLGLLLLGALYLAIGIFASAMTRNQVLALVIAFVIILCMALLIGILINSTFQEYLPQTLQRFLRFIDISRHFEAFSRGLIDTGNIVFFVLTTGLFLFLATKVLEMRRWW